jgi:predicted permease
VIHTQLANLLFILGISFGSLFVGIGARALLLHFGLMPAEAIWTLSKYLKLFSLVVMIPIPVINTFWKFSLPSGPLLAMPLLGILSWIVGGVSAAAANRVFRIPPKRAGSVFACGMFTNLTSFGRLIAFVMFGDRGFFLVQLFIVFETLIYYAIGFPLSHQISAGESGKFRFRANIIMKQPLTVIPLLYILFGVLLNVSGLQRPRLFDDFSGYLIPSSVVALGLSIGMTLRFGRISRYRVEVLLIMAIKFLVVPLVVIPAAYLLGMHRILDGIPMKVVIILSFMPVAFTALLPPALYGFDLDLANSGWIVTTLFMLIVLPAVYWLLV